MFTLSPVQRLRFEAGEPMRLGNHTIQTGFRTYGVGFLRTCCCGRVEDERLVESLQDLCLGRCSPDPVPCSDRMVRKLGWGALSVARDSLAPRVNALGLLAVVFISQGHTLHGQHWSLRLGYRLRCRQDDRPWVIDAWFSDANVDQLADRLLSAAEILERRVC